MTLKFVLEVTQAHGNGYHSKALSAISYSTSITMAASCMIFDIKQYISRKSRFFHTPLAFDAPVRRGPPSEYCHTVWYEKLESCV